MPITQKLLLVCAIFIVVAGILAMVLGASFTCHLMGSAF